MSSRKQKKVEKSEFIDRFVEICGSSQPMEISESLNISHQAVRNYFKGRLPDAKILMTIADNTPYSIHWLLTGRGAKFVEDVPNTDDDILVGKIREAFREELDGAFEIVSDELTDPAVLKKIVFLGNNKIKQENNVSDPAVKK